MIFKERHPHHVSGAFHNSAAANDAMRDLVDNDGFEREQLRLVEPGDEEFARKVEPDSRGIFWTWVYAHAWFAGAGLLLGVTLALLMVNFGPEFTRSNPAYTILGMGWVGFLGTALLGGLVTLRPDRDPLMFQTRDASHNGHWSVVAHCRDLSQKSAVLSRFEGRSLATAQSL